MRKKIFWVALLLFLGQTHAQNTLFSTAKTQKVQLYFDGAKMEQTAEISVPKGISEIILLNVANSLDENSIQLKSVPSLTILSVQFSKNPIEGVEISEKNRINDSIQLIENQIVRENLLKKSILKSVEVLDKNQQIPSGNFSAAELSKLVDFQKTKRLELEVQLSDSDKKITNLQKKLNFLKYQNKDNLLQNGANNGKIILQVMNQTAGKIPFEFSYITRQANWFPFYEIRAEKLNQPISFVYNAAITQITGVDWKSVKVSLSSTYASNYSSAPQLNTWFISPEEKITYQNAEVVKVAFSAPRKAAMIGKIQAVQAEEIPKLSEKSLDDVVMLNQKQLSVVFDIDLPYTILSNGKKHSISLKNTKIPMEYRYYSVPKYDETAFLTGKITNFADYNLLNGSANVIFEGIYVGKTQINPENTDKELVVTLGNDKNIAVNRKLISKNVANKSFSSKKTERFLYEISVKNNKKEAIEILLEDQIPISTNKEISVNLTEKNGANFNAENGRLEWKLKLQPNENQVVRFSFEVESPKEINVVY